MRAEFTQYSVPGWGVGELWTRERLLLAHEFRFQPVSDTGRRAHSVTSPVATPKKTRQLRTPSTQSDVDSACGGNGTLSSRVALDRRRCLTPDLLTARFAAFLGGADVSFEDVEIDLGWATPFQHAVVEALRRIPRGEVVSYGEVSALAGYPGAARAVGTICAHNRFMLVVPCHRVVGAAAIGGYGSADVSVKRRLLALEGVVL